MSLILRSRTTDQPTYDLGASGKHDPSSNSGPGGSPTGKGVGEGGFAGAATAVGSNVSIVSITKRLLHASRTSAGHSEALGSLKWPTTTIGTGAQSRGTSHSFFRS